MADAKAKAAPPAEKKVQKEKFPKPDKSEYQTAVDEIQRQIKEHQDELHALSQQIGAKSTGKEEFIRRKAEMKSKLDEYQDIIDRHEGEKRKIYDTMKQQQDASRAARNELHAMKNKLPHGSVEEIDQEIAKIEYKLQTETLTLKQEKALLVQIQQLKGSKPEIAKYAKKSLNAPNVGEDNVGVLKENLEKLKKMIEEARDAKKVQAAQYSKLIEQRQKAMSDMPELFDKRDGINKKITAKIQSRKALQEVFQSKNREWQAHVAEQNAVRYEKQRADRLQRAAVNEKRKAELKNEEEEEQPHLAETILIEQTIAYCQTLIKKEEKEEVEEKADVKHNNPEGSMVLANKKDRDLEMITVGGGRKKKGPKKVEKKDDGKIKHTLASLDIFGKLKLDPPVSVSDVPAVITKLETKLGSYKDKVKAWEADKEDRARRAAQALKDAQARAEDLERQAKEALEQAKARSQALNEDAEE